MLTAQIDTSGLALRLEELRQVMIASGGQSDASVLIREEAGKLAMQCAITVAAPKSLSRARKNIDADVQTLLRPYRRNITKSHRGKGDLLWSVVGPKFLYGIPPGRDWTDSDSNVPALYKRLRNAGRIGQLGNQIIEIGKRKNQTVYKVNRFVVSRQAFNSLKKSLQNRLGRQKAAWAQSAKACGRTDIPEWINKHIPTPKSHIDLSSLRSESPSIQFSNRSIGVQKTRDAVSKAVEIRAAHIEARMRLIIRGYAKDVKQRRPIRHHAGETSSASD